MVACRFWLMATPNVLKLLVYFPHLQWQYISCDLFPTPRNSHKCFIKDRWSLGLAFWMGGYLGIDRNEMCESSPTCHCYLIPNNKQIANIYIWVDTPTKNPFHTRDSVVGWFKSTPWTIHWWTMFVQWRVHYSLSTYIRSSKWAMSESPIPRRAIDPEVTVNSSFSKGTCTFNLMRYILCTNPSTSGPLLVINLFFFGRGEHI